MRIPQDVFTSTLQVRVGYVDTDQAAVMHHGTYFRYLETARVEYLRERGLEYRKFELDSRLGLPVVEVKVRYSRNANFDDELEIVTWIGLLNRAKLRFDSVIQRDGELITRAQITLCCIRLPEGKLCSMPEQILALA